jgi:hypothetical protein
MALEVRLAYWAVRIEAKAIFAPKELAELEGVLWLLAFYRLRFWCWRWYGIHNLGHRRAL